MLVNFIRCKIFEYQQVYYGASILQVARPNQWSGLAEQLKYPRADDKANSFITLNDANRLCHLVRLNVGKHQRKAGQLRSLDGLRMHFDYDYRY